MRAPDWDFRSASGWWKRWEVESGSKANGAKEAPLPSPCRSKGWRYETAQSWLSRTMKKICTWSPSSWKKPVTGFSRRVTGSPGSHWPAEILPDLILLDIQLPGWMGIAVARELTKNGDLGHVPIVAVTSYAMHGRPGACPGGGLCGLYRKTDQPGNVCGRSRTIPADRRDRSRQGVTHDEYPRGG